jgi:hypothetical protein
VTPRFHFILNEDGTSHLFDLADVAEERDLGLVPEYLDTVSALTQQTTDLWDRPGRPVSGAVPPAAARVTPAVAAGAQRRGSSP